MVLARGILIGISLPVPSPFFFIQNTITNREITQSHLAAVKSSIIFLSFDSEMAGTNGHNQEQVSLPAYSAWAGCDLSWYKANGAKVS